MFDTLKKFVSRVTGARIEKGYGVSFDSGISVDKETAIKPIPFQRSKLTVKYKLADDVGTFELDTQVRGRDGKTKYRIIHSETGMIFLLHENLFTLLFKSIPRGNDGEN